MKQTFYKARVLLNMVQTEGGSNKYDFLQFDT